MPSGDAPGSRRSRLRGTSALALLAVGWLLAVSPVRAQGVTCACSRSYCPADDPPFFGPGPPPTLAPNARIFARLGQYDPASVTLTTSSGEPVAFTLEPAGDAAGIAFWVVPTAPLPAGSYAVSATSRGSLSGTARQELSVSGGMDVDAPVAAGLRVFDLQNVSYCTELVGARIVLDRASGELDGAVTAEIELSRGGVVFARAFSARPPVGFIEFGTAASPECFGSAHVDGLVDGELLTARVRVWDDAGNASAFETTTLTVSRVAGMPSCSRNCSAVPGRANAGLEGWALLIVGVAWSRRRRRREP